MHVVVTGSSHGIGRELVTRLKSLGHQVIGTSRDHSSGVRLDVADSGQQARFAAQLNGQPIDLLVCNAGVYLDRAMSIEDYTSEIWAQSMAVNVTGIFMTVQALLPNLRRAEAPKIAIIAPQMDDDTSQQGRAYAYRASKAAALNVGQNLATDLRSDGVAVGIYHPGRLRTNLDADEGEISVEESVDGLMREFDALDLETTGCFHTWDGRIHSF